MKLSVVPDLKGYEQAIDDLGADELSTYRRLLNFLAEVEVKVTKLVCQNAVQCSATRCLWSTAFMEVVNTHGEFVFWHPLTNKKGFSCSATVTGGRQYRCYFHLPSGARAVAELFDRGIFAFDPDHPPLETFSLEKAPNPLVKTTRARQDRVNERRRVVKAEMLARGDKLVTYMSNRWMQKAA